MNLRYSTENSMLCGDLNEKEFQGRGDICICVADSLCCTAETQHRKATKLQFKERPHCPNPCSFLGQNGYCDFSNFIFLCQICFSYSSTFTFHVTFRIRWLISTGILIETMLNLKVNLGRDDILIKLNCFTAFLWCPLIDF